MEINEILQQRITKLNALKDKGFELYASLQSGAVTIARVRAAFEADKKVLICGRVMAKRSHGKVSFMDLRDSTDRIQLYLKADQLDPKTVEAFTELDIADIVSVEGALFITHTGEMTVKVEKLVVLAKALRPLPEKWHGLKDVEIRYRQRYLDLISNDEVKQVFLKRAKIIKAIRSFLDREGFLEVETPMMHDIAGGAAGRPFKTFHNEYSMDLYLRIAPELYLKRLIVGGLDKVYEINRSFRNEGVSTRHNPEFTMLETYTAYANYEDMMNFVQNMFAHVAKEVLGDLKFTYQGKPIDLTPPWPRRSFTGIVKEKFGIEPSDDPEVMLKKLKDNGFARETNVLSRSQVTKVIEDILEEDMSANPTFVTDYFASMSPLAQVRKDNPLIAERFELYIAGMEVGNAYSELNDPIAQRKKFEDEIKDLDPAEKKNLDLDYITALEHGMPPAGGLGVGIDRLVMLLTDQASIRDVILFPLLRSQETI